jgi:D-tyrosyl-tRNA(Tyr) deacylase
MKVLVTRINKGEIAVEGKVISLVGKGIALFVGVEKGDGNSLLVSMADRVANLRIFQDQRGKMHYSVKDKNYQILCISNFTLCANTDKGRRPSFEDSMAPDSANKIFEDFVLLLKSKGVDVKTGIFGEYMNVRLEMDGPVNIILQAK